jgi:hypothetical protein
VSPLQSLGQCLYTHTHTHTHSLSQNPNNISLLFPCFTHPTSHQILKYDDDMIPSPNPQPCLSHLLPCERRLRELGYKQELKRELTSFTNFSVSFSIVSILTGLTSLYGTALNSGGPAVIIWGWVMILAATTLIYFSPCCLRKKGKSWPKYSDGKGKGGLWRMCSIGKGMVPSFANTL